MDLAEELARIKENMTSAPFDGKAADVILFLVCETLNALERGITSAGFERSQIVHGCLPAGEAPQVDPKTWMPKEAQWFGVRHNGKTRKMKESELDN